MDNKEGLTTLETLIRISKKQKATSWVFVGVTDINFKVTCLQAFAMINCQPLLLVMWLNFLQGPNTGKGRV